MMVRFAGLVVVGLGAFVGGAMGGVTPDMTEDVPNNSSSTNRQVTRQVSPDIPTQEEIEKVVPRQGRTPDRNTQRTPTVPPPEVVDKLDNDMPNPNPEPGTASQTPQNPQTPRDPNTDPHHHLGDIFVDVILIGEVTFSAPCRDNGQGQKLLHPPSEPVEATIYFMSQMQKISVGKDVMSFRPGMGEPFQHDITIEAERDMALWRAIKASQDRSGVNLHPNDEQAQTSTLQICLQPKMYPLERFKEDIQVNTGVFHPIAGLQRNFQYEVADANPSAEPLKSVLSGNCEVDLPVTGFAMYHLRMVPHPNTENDHVDRVRWKDDQENGANGTDGTNGVNGTSNRNVGQDAPDVKNTTPVTPSQQSPEGMQVPDDPNTPQSPKDHTNTTTTRRSTVQQPGTKGNATNSRKNSVSPVPTHGQTQRAAGMESISNKQNE